MTANETNGRTAYGRSRITRSEVTWQELTTRPPVRNFPAAAMTIIRSWARRFSWLPWKSPGL